MISHITIIKDDSSVLCGKLKCKEHFLSTDLSSYLPRGSLFHIVAAEIMKDLFVIFNRHKPSSSFIRYHLE